MPFKKSMIELEKEAPDEGSEVSILNLLFYTLGPRLFSHLYNNVFLTPINVRAVSPPVCVSVSGTLYIILLIVEPNSEIGGAFCLVGN